MNNFLDITSDDIRRLDDSVLRELIGRLCEAEVRSCGLPVSGVTWGGDQDAPDGGIDVMVRSEAAPNWTGFIPRPMTGFQVKATDMTASKIDNEMKPNGDLRPSIRNLIVENG